jgi:hypothetical protein
LLKKQDAKDEEPIMAENTDYNDNTVAKDETEHETGIIYKEDAVKKAIEYCVDNDILKDFLGKNAAKVTNMLMEELYWDDRLALRQEEGKMDSKKVIARNALAEGLPIEIVQKITGLDIETVKSIQTKL